MNAQPTQRINAAKLRTWGAAVALAFGAGSALAESSSSSVAITSFSYTTTGGTMLSWSDPYQSFQALAMNAGGLLGTKSDSFDTADYFFAIVAADTSQASAATSTASPQTFLASASTTSSIGLATNQPNKAQSIVNQSGAFMLSGAGSVTFNVGYTLAVSAPGGNALSDYGTTLVSFDAANSAGSSGGMVGDQLMSFNQASGVGSKTGTLALTVSLATDETGYYNLRGNSIAWSSAAMAAPVPEPGSWALMLAGLAGVVAVARRRSGGTAPA